MPQFHTRNDTGMHLPLPFPTFFHFSCNWQENCSITQVFHKNVLKLEMLNLREVQNGLDMSTTKEFSASST